MKRLINVLITGSLIIGTMYQTQAQKLDVIYNNFDNQRQQLLFYKSGLDTLKNMVQPNIFQPEQLPFFCKYEHKLDLQIPLKVRFRLGSLDYVNRLEGKY